MLRLPLYNTNFGLILTDKHAHLYPNQGINVIILLSQTEINSNNYWPEADMYYTRLKIIGVLSNRKSQTAIREISCTTKSLSQKLPWIFSNTRDKIYRLCKTGQLNEQVEQSDFKSFTTISRTTINHHKNILNYFDNRSTNTSAESFSANHSFQTQYRCNIKKDASPLSFQMGIP